MIHLAFNSTGVIEIEADNRTGMVTVPVGYSICLSSYDPIAEAFHSLKEKLNPNNLDIEVCLWDDVNKCLVLSPQKQYAKRQTKQRLFGEHLIKEIIDMIGARNLDLESRGIVIDMIGLAADNSGVKLLVETGALATASVACSQLKLKYINHSDIYDYLIADISIFLTTNGWI